ncbi:MAG: glycerate kinase [Chloroflexi bacterium]|nr:glycerate kinase [Chloroflexota bacterium]
MSTPLHVVLAPQSFKGTLTALEVARAMAEGVRRVVPDARLDLVPMADGGEGTVQALVDATGGRLVHTRVLGPLGEPVDAVWGILGDGKTAVVEMAAASGLPLVPPERRNPRLTTTFGTGQLIRAALDAGCRSFIVGIGGSATNDGGTGVARALGVRFLDARGDELPFGGAALARLDRIDTADLDPRVRASTFRVASDVTNPLCGPTGASAVYGPQKGATPAMVAELDAALDHYAAVVARDLGIQVRDLPGAGAAGGLGAGLVAFLGARLQRGVQLVVGAVGIEARVRGADLVFTGEGQIDGQTVFGKTPVGVAEVARRSGVPVVAIVGGIGEGYRAVFAHGIDAVLSITSRPMTLAEAAGQAPALVADAAETAIRLILLPVRGKE